MVNAINNATDDKNSTQWDIAGKAAKKSKAGITGNNRSVVQSFQLIILAINQKKQVTANNIFPLLLVAVPDFLLTINPVKTFL
jgi:hypothetical protein